MSNTEVTVKIYQAVEHAKSRAKSAEQAFECANNAIQRQARQSINLFGGSARSTVANIARDVRRACDDVYSAYQSLIVTLDETCRPLLNEDPDMLAVKAVAELMKKLNDDSEIDVDFTASLNGSNLGDVAGSRYVPSMNCKMIQRYWEDRYSAWPGRAEMETQARRKEQELKQAAEAQALQKEQRLRQAAEAQARKQYEDHKKLYDDQMKRYEQDMQKYDQDMQAYQQQLIKREAEIKRIDDLRAKELKSREEAYVKEQYYSLEKEYTKRKKKLEQSKSRHEKERDQALADLAQAGFFAFSKKKETKSIIADKEHELTVLESELQNAEKTYQDRKNNVTNEVSKMQGQFLAAIEKKYPHPPAPHQPVRPMKPRQP